MDDVTRDQLICLDRRDCAIIAYDFTYRRSHGLERLNGLFGTVVLEEADDNVQEDDCIDDTSFDAVECRIAEDHGDDQDEGQAVRDLTDEDVPPRDASRGLKLVAAIFLSAACSFVRGQTCSTMVSENMADVY